MGKKRANGEGSIYKRKSDNRWTGKLQIGYLPNGSPKYKIVYGNSQREVKEKLDELKQNLKTNTFVESNKVTIGEWLDKWLNISIKTSVKNTTWLIYKNMIECHLKPALGGIKLQSLQTSHIQNLYNEKCESGRADGKDGGLSPKSIKHMHQVLKSSLDQAKKEGYITNNPAEACRIPKISQKEMQTLSVEQAHKFLKSVKKSKYYKKYYPMFILELYTGLRRGELLGLRWKDVNTSNGLIYVMQQVTLEHGKVIIREPKTDSSQNRVIAVPQEAVTLLNKHKQKKINDYKLLGYEENEIEDLLSNGFVFSNESGGPFHPRRFVRSFKGALEEAGLPTTIRFHDMRHTFVLLSLQQGIDIKTIQSDLGHNDISTTLNRYGHVNQQMKNAAAQKRSELFKGILE